MTIKTITHFLKRIFLDLSPILIFSVSGNSMEPTYKNGDKIIAQRCIFVVKDNDPVIVKDLRDQRFLLKRVQKSRITKQGREYFVIGDNLAESTDSRHFGWLPRQYILAKVIWQGKS